MIKHLNKRIIKEVEKIANTTHIKGTRTYADGLVQRDVMEENEKQLELIAFFEKLLNEKIPKERRGGISDANIVSSFGVTTLDGFGPFGDGDHTKKERALKSSFEQRINMMTTILNYYQKNI